MRIFGYCLDRGMVYLASELVNRAVVKCALPRYSAKQKGQLSEIVRYRMYPNFGASDSNSKHDRD